MAARTLRLLVVAVTAGDTVTHAQAGAMVCNISGAICLLRAIFAPH